MGIGQSELPLNPEYTRSTCLRLIVEEHQCESGVGRGVGVETGTIVGVGRGVAAGTGDMVEANTGGFVASI